MTTSGLIDKVTEAYVATRVEISQLNAKIDELKELQAKREDWLYAEMTKIGVSSVKTGHGSVFVKLKESVTVADWAAVLNWARREDKFEFLNAAVSKKAVLEYMGKDREVAPPPGVNYVAVRTVQIRKAGDKA